MSKKSRPRHLTGKNKPGRKTLQPRSAVFSQDEPTPVPVARPETATTRPFRSVTQAVARPARAVAPILPTSYDYVVSDLKRIGMISAVLIAILIVLTFVIR